MYIIYNSVCMHLYTSVHLQGSTGVINTLINTYIWLQCVINHLVNDYIMFVEGRLKQSDHFVQI